MSKERYPPKRSPIRRFCAYPKFISFEMEFNRHALFVVNVLSLPVPPTPTGQVLRDLTSASCLAWSAGGHCTHGGGGGREGRRRRGRGDGRGDDKDEDGERQMT